MKLSSPEGIQRGANPAKVYDGARILASQPTRLFVDAGSTEEWRNKSFHPVLNEAESTPELNLKNSVLYVALYGIRRTHASFWRHADWFHAQYRREQPLQAGLYDLNRYQNR